VRVQDSALTPCLGLECELGGRSQTLQGWALFSSEPDLALTAQLEESVLAGSPHQRYCGLATVWAAHAGCRRGVTH
jgi:hypothetical protein